MLDLDAIEKRARGYVDRYMRDELHLREVSDAADDAVIQSFLAACDAIVALAILPHPRYRHRRGRGVSRASKRRYRRRWDAQMGRAAAHEAASRAWCAVAEVVRAIGGES